MCQDFACDHGDSSDFCWNKARERDRLTAGCDLFVFSSVLVLNSGDLVFRHRSMGAMSAILPVGVSRFSSGFAAGSGALIPTCRFLHISTHETASASFK